MDIRTPGLHELDAILAMLTRAYRAARADFPDDPRVLGAYGAHDPGGGPANWVVAFDDDRPLAALRLFFRTIHTSIGDLEIGGIGNVGTDPDAGGRGLGSTVMRAAHDRILERGCRAALLVTDIPDFYRRLGYETVRQPELRGTVVPERETPVAARRLRAPVADEVDRWHARLVAETSGRVVRSEALWTRWILDFKVAGTSLDAVHGEGAYLIGRPENEGRHYRVFEAGGDPAAVLALVRAHAGRAVLWKMPDDSVCRAVLASADADVSTRERTGIMAAVMDGAAAVGDGAAATHDQVDASLFSGFLELDAF